MRYFKFSCLIVVLFTVQFATAQEKIKHITRNVKGELITMSNDTLFGMIMVKNYEDHYVTSINFKQDGGSKRRYTAYDVKWFRQVVPYPDREAFGVDNVYFVSGPHPADEKKKVFLPSNK